MTLISIKKTAVVEPAPTGTVSVYVDAADGHTKQVDEAGAIIDLTDGSAISSPNMANEVNITLTALRALTNYQLKTTYRITDASQGVVRVYVKSATELTATAMLEGTDSGTGSITAGQWGNYDLDGDVFTPTATSGTWTPIITGIVGAATVDIIGTSRYTQIGDTVTDVCAINVIMDAGQSLEEFDISMAVLPATNFANSIAVQAMWSATASISEYDTVEIRSTVATKLTHCSVTMNGTEINATFVMQRTYSIL